MKNIKSKQADTDSKYTCDCNLNKNGLGEYSFDDHECKTESGDTIKDDQNETLHQHHKNNEIQKQDKQDESKANFNNDEEYANSLIDNMKARKQCILKNMNTNYINKFFIEFQTPTKVKKY